nr:MAG TPA: hypothetical protein [Caudoviricetes sp.]
MAVLKVNRLVRVFVCTLASLKISVNFIKLYF